jgi:UbiD family decarboxylase
VAIAIGVHPAVLFASSYSVPPGYDEFRLASSLLGKPLELVRCRDVGLEAPAHAEIVIEGRMLPHERAEEGPFVDITGTYDAVRKQPIIEVSRIYHRRQAIYHALLPSGKEHKIFMGMPQEPRIYNSVSEVAKVVNVCLTEGGCNWLHGVVAISKASEDDGKKAIMAALEGHPSMKHVVVVDEDIDIFNSNDVEFAIATRFQGDRDIVMIENVKGSSLDPSANKTGLTTKMGFDATKPLGREADYQKAKMPERS